MLRLLRPKTGKNMWENIVEESENETRSVYTPTKSVRINSTQNDAPTVSRNIWELSFLQKVFLRKILQRLPVWDVSNYEFFSWNPL